jgi:hypothetical protein
MALLRLRFSLRRERETFLKSALEPLEVVVAVETEAQAKMALLRLRFSLRRYGILKSALIQPTTLLRLRFSLRRYDH